MLVDWHGNEIEGRLNVVNFGNLMETAAGAATLYDRETGINFMRKMLFAAACCDPQFHRTLGLEVDVPIHVVGGLRDEAARDIQRVFRGMIARSEMEMVAEVAHDRPPRLSHVKRPLSSALGATHTRTDTHIHTQTYIHVHVHVLTHIPCVCSG